jgi:hypothetical protein
MFTIILSEKNLPNVLVVNQASCPNVRDAVLEYFEGFGVAKDFQGFENRLH